MQDRKNKIYFYKYIYALIMFLGVLILPFLLLSFENEFYSVLEEYDDAITYAVSEEFSSITRNKILELQVKVEEAKVKLHYKSFVTLMIIIIFLSLFNYLYIKLGIKYKLVNNSPSMNLNKNIIVIVSIVEIIYFVGLLLLASSSFIGINFWTLFFVNLIIVIFLVVVSLQIQYFLSPKNKE